MRWLGTVLIAVVLGISAVGCSGSTSTPSSTTTQNAYTCPMCGGAYEAPGKCPHCGMALIRK